MKNCQMNNEQYGCYLYKETEEHGEKEVGEYDIQ